MTSPSVWADSPKTKIPLWMGSQYGKYTAVFAPLLPSIMVSCILFALGLQGAALTVMTVVIYVVMGCLIIWVATAIAHASIWHPAGKWQVLEMRHVDWPEARSEVRLTDKWFTVQSLDNIMVGKTYRVEMRVVDGVCYARKFVPA